MCVSPCQLKLTIIIFFVTYILYIYKIRLTLPEGVIAGKINSSLAVQAARALPAPSPVSDNNCFLKNRSSR